MRLGLGLGFHRSRPATSVAAWSPADDFGTADAPYWWQQAGTGDLTDADDTDPLLTRVNAAVDRRASFQLVQATEAAKPLRETVSGLAAYALASANSRRLASTGLPTGAPTGANPRIMIALVDQPIIASNTTNNTKVFLAYGRGGAGQFRLARFSQGGRNRLTVSDGTTSVIDAATDDTRNFDGVCVVVGWYDGTRMHTQINGYDGASSAADITLATDATGTARVRIGANASDTASQFADGHFFEGCILPWIAEAELRDAKIDQWVGYLAHRAGIAAKLPADHPYKAAAPLHLLTPTNLVAPAITGTAALGETLTCSTGSWTLDPTLAYQWRRDSVSIAGATASTYELEEVDEGTTISCTVTATGADGFTAQTATGVYIDPTYWMPLIAVDSGDVAAWFDPRIGLTSSSSRDRVGGVTAAQLDPTLQPATGPTEFLGTYPGIQPDGVDDFLEAAPVPTTGEHAWPVGIEAGWECWLVNQLADPAIPGAKSPGGYGSGVFERKLSRVSNSSGGPAANRVSITDGTDLYIDLTLDFSGVCVVFGIYQPTQKQIRLNGVNGAVHSGSLSSTSTTRVRIGKSPDTAEQKFVGEIAHYFVGRGIPTTDLLERLEAWLLWQVGEQDLLPEGHTWRLERPTVVGLPGDTLIDTDGASLIDTDGADLFDDLAA